MAITRPVTRTIISTTGWGIPITDAVNALAPTAWVNLTLQNGWVNEGGGYTVGRYRKVGDTVSVMGSFTGGSTGVVLAALPVGFRPIGSIKFPTYTEQPVGTPKMALTIVYSNGDIQIHYAGTNAVMNLAFSTT